MRIEFLHSAREDFPWTAPQLRIGSAADNDLVLSAGQAAPRHLRIEQDQRGWVLAVLPSATRVYVNARPVRERALLRPGDMLSVGDCRMLLRDDVAPEQRETVMAPLQAHCTAALRALAGALSGRVFSIGDGLELGPYGRCPLELPQGETASLKLNWQDDHLVLEVVQASATYPLRVNGATVQRLALRPGDQISLGPHRFVLDAPGMEAEPEVTPSEPVTSALPEDVAGPRGEVWWLIVTAAVLALGIALVLWMRF
ncbi:FHA domain-containing protein [Rhodanobacter sp. 7MK24]|uniref:FHA domain-containing protein n=1 Tax=Rhodanobacter sp. 7MK24 TaxID=2775922 RepID=UPI00177BA73D|nr:FHA domain-containing protein [Rhodanobacter sp. 7MK24]MBD8879735.1 FHA domain-containing protein [Rhodanobacter sp. 7MK24]